VSGPVFLDLLAMPIVPTACGERARTARRRAAPRALARAWRWGPLVLMLLAASASACARPARELDAAKVCALVRAATKAGDDLLLARSLAEELGLEPSNLWIDRNGVFVRQGGRRSDAQGLFLARPGVTPPAEGADPSFTLVSGCVYRYAIKG
jgi:hypothetical protein